MFEDLDASHSKEQREREDLLRTLEKIKVVSVFDAGYLDELKLVLFGEDRPRVFHHGRWGSVQKGDLTADDFMSGRRTDFVGIQPREEFEKTDLEQVNDRHALPFLFLQGKLCFEEFVAHEIAHNRFDINYKQAVGEYEEVGDWTDVSDEYRGKIIDIISKIAEKYLSQLEISRFAFSRQQIAEIYAMLYERELCRRQKINEEVHAGVEQNVTNFLAKPEETLAQFNNEHGRNCTMQDLFEENHILSLMIAPAIEKEFPEFEKRTALFFPDN